MPKRYPAEFRSRVLDLVASGRKVTEVAQDLGLSPQTIYSWRRQDEIDAGERPGLRNGATPGGACGPRMGQVSLTRTTAIGANLLPGVSFRGPVGLAGRAPRKASLNPSGSVTGVTS